MTTAWGCEAQGWSVLVHGGAGVVRKELWPSHTAGCREAAEEAAAVLRGGGCALDAVQRAVEVLETNPVFNAGTGACLNEEGNIELDATLMDGSGRRAGAVGALPPFDHPIAIARAVLEEGRHVLLVGDGARRFAEANGFAPSQSAAMTTPGAQERWELWKRGGKVWPGGTVGAVARDASGRVAAATSTGGMVGKAPGRVGDSAVVGAGTYAEDLAGSASCTGHGEAMIRLVAASRAVEFLRDGVAPEDAARAVIGMLGDSLGAKGGIILADRWGRLGFARNTETMAWAALGEAFPQGAAGMDEGG